MAVKIRLMRVGKKKQPTYRVVVADARSPRDGRIIESIGLYAPRHEPSRVEIDGDKALGWLRHGAQPTEQAQKLLAATGVWERYEQERGGPVRTKLARRGVTPGTAPPAPPPAPPTSRKTEQAEPTPDTVRADDAEVPVPEATTEPDDSEEPA